MDATQFMGGRVTRWRSRVYEGRPPADAPVLKRISLPQGELGQIFDGDEAWRYLAWLEMRPGTVRGNHYHERKREYLYSIDCELRAVFVDRATGERETATLEPGDLLYVPPGLAHALETVKGGYAIEMTPERLDLADSFPYVVVAQTARRG